MGALSCARDEPRALRWSDRSTMRVRGARPRPVNRPQRRVMSARALPHGTGTPERVPSGAGRPLDLAPVGLRPARHRDVPADRAAAVDRATAARIGSDLAAVDLEAARIGSDLAAVDLEAARIENREPRVRQVAW